MNTLSAREAYRLWAPRYGENTITILELQVATALSPPSANRRLLDAGCGTGTRLPTHGAELAVGIDFSPEMLFAGGAANLAAADVRALPFADNVFDLIWCRLVLGYLADAAPAYRELARVCRPNGHLLISDFHPDAVAAGHRRRLVDSGGSVHDIEHHVHGDAGHKRMAADAGFILSTQRDGVIDASVRDFYLRAGREAAYEKDRGLAVVAAFLFRRG